MMPRPIVRALEDGLPHLTGSYVIEMPTRRALAGSSGTDTT